MKYVVGLFMPDESSYQGSNANGDALSEQACKAHIIRHTAPYRNVMIHWEQFFDNASTGHPFFGYARLEEVIRDGVPAPQPLALLHGYREPSPRDTKFLDKQRAGEIVVNNHFVWKSTIASEPVPLVIKTTPATWSYGWFGKKFGGDTVMWLARYRRQTVEYAQTWDAIELNNVYKNGPPISYAIEKSLINDIASEADDLILDLLTSVAELPETLKWLADLIKQAADATKAARKKEIEVVKLLKRKGRTAEQIARAIASVWMQYRYAIMPIAMSIEDVIKALESWKRTYGKVRGKHVISYSESELRSWFNLNPDHYVTVKESSQTHRCFIKRGYDPRGLVDAILQTLKLNPITTAWELVPLSFVVDWFVNIGQVLTISTTPAHHEQEGATYSWKTVIEFVVSNPETGASYSYAYEGYKRQVINPQAEYGLTLGWDMNWKRYLDSIALLLNPSLKILKNAKAR